MSPEINHCDSEILNVVRGIECEIPTIFQRHDFDLVFCRHLGEPMLTS